MEHIVNTQQAEAWNGYDGQYWADYSEHWDRVVGGLNEPLFASATVGATENVLDVGCGTGQTTRLAAGMAVGGHALGVDLSGPMIRRARFIAEAQGIENVRFEHADAQVHPLPPEEFDVAISRGGLTFFADPVAAFANIASSLRPDGRLTFVCLQEMSRQEWFTVLTSALLGRAPRPDTTDPYAPGMFSLTDPERIRAVLAGAGFAHIAIAPIEVPMMYGPDATQAAQMHLGSGPVRFRLKDADETTEAQARRAVTTALRPYEGPEGVQLRGAYWLVSAVRPEVAHRAGPISSDRTGGQS
ncbi:methyltransferase domain-containing protein [Asanoa sp. NPDC049518]|uniref:class I SAM-dependent methyltransferase n=1 Tax=unclassified Asanoa TaxID=2685164 RepID=UPI0034390DD4